MVGYTLYDSEVGWLVIHYDSATRSTQSRHCNGFRGEIDAWHQATVPDQFSWQSSTGDRGTF